MSRVAVVDDDASIRQLLTQVLPDAYLRVRAFEDGATALVGLQERPCDLLLVDYQLPDMTGLELAVAVRDHNPELPVALGLCWLIQIEHRSTIVAFLRDTTRHHIMYYNGDHSTSSHPVVQSMGDPNRGEWAHR